MSAPLALVFTPRALGLAKDLALTENSLLEGRLEDESRGLHAYRVGKYAFILDDACNAHSMLIVVRAAPAARAVLTRLQLDAVGGALDRLATAALRVERSHSWDVPRAWNPFRHENKAAFFASPRGVATSRFVCSVEGEGGRRDILVDRLTTAEKPIRLDAHEMDKELYLGAIEHFGEALLEHQGRLGLVSGETVSLSYLEEARRQHVGARNFDRWMNDGVLTTRQVKFVRDAPKKSIKLLGPAGSGKTLAMMLKAISLMLEGLEAARIPRILYLTHSRALSEDVRRDLWLLSDLVGDEIQVDTLMELAQRALPKPAGTVLGSDNHEGKLAQLQRILDLIRRRKKRKDWASTLQNISEVLRARLAGGDNALKALAWDLMHEFACVLSASGIKGRGVANEDSYLAIKRMPWMMTLESQADLRLIFDIYCEHTDDLRRDRLVPVDHLVNDYLNTLTTHRWDYARHDEGYDYVFVDEFHLFNEQERYVFHYLTRQPDKLPVLFLALDPKQSPSETYPEFGWSLTASERADPERMQVLMGDPDEVVLDEVHRYTKQILAFLRHFDASYPAWDFGRDWTLVDLSNVTSRTNGPVPALTRYGRPEAAMRGALHSALGRHGSATSAVLCLDSSEFETLAHLVRTHADHGKYFVAAGREEAERHKYSRRRVLVSMPEFVAGQQFDHVLLTGFPDAIDPSRRDQAPAHRRFVSMLYLGASRARESLALHVGVSGEFATLQNAVNDGRIVVTGSAEPILQ